MADMAFVGGTLVDVGGHNPLEPLHFEIPVFMGPYHHNFSTIVERLQAQGALKVVANPQVLSDAMLALWRSPAKYELARQGAKLVKVQNQGSLNRQCAIVQQYLQ
jgi:3-deoxy-D-manno-octulosonic-acid transferase